MPKFSCVILAVATVVNIQGLAGASEECTLGYGTLDVTTSSQYLVSPNHPQRYPNEMECTRRLKAPSGSRIIVFIRDIDMEETTGCRRDYLEFSEGHGNIATMCGEGVPSVVSAGDMLTVKFKTDLSVSGRGFRLEYRIWREDDRTNCPPEFSPALKATDVDTTLQSPGYPQSYSFSLNCYWMLEAQDSNKVIQIVVDDSTLESGCNYDSVTAYDGRRRASGKQLLQWCGTDRPSFSSLSSSMLLHFRTDATRNFEGFSLRFRQVSREEATIRPGFCPSEPSAITIKHEYSELISPNYPADYKSNLDCIWLLKASVGLVVELAVRDSRIENNCNYDHVTVIDGDNLYSNVLGTFCGSETPTYYSTGRYLIVRFQTDGSGQYKGFRMEYRQLSPDDVPKGVGLEVILPSVFASIATAALCCYCCKRCCCNDKEEDSANTTANTAANAAANAAGDTGQDFSNAIYTHPTVTWTSGGTASSGGAPYPRQPNVYADAPPYPVQPTYPPQQPPVDGYSATNGSNPPPSGYPSPLRPPSPYYSPGHQSDVEGGRASPLMPSAPPPPPSAPSLRVMEDPPPSYDSLRFDDVTGAPLLPSSAQGGAEGGEENIPLYDRKC